eukprot:scaffold204792_cov34-Tisochrysis_lutea.AAC.3
MLKTGNALLARSLTLFNHYFPPPLGVQGFCRVPPPPAPPAASPLRTTPSRPTKGNGVGEGPPSTSTIQQGYPSPPPIARPIAVHACPPPDPRNRRLKNEGDAAKGG